MAGLRQVSTHPEVRSQQRSRLLSERRAGFRIASGMSRKKTNGRPRWSIGAPPDLHIVVPFGTISRCVARVRASVSLAALINQEALPT